MPLKICPNCNKGCMEDNEYCPSCKTKFPDINKKFFKGKYCFNCGNKINDENTQLCANCGVKLTSASQTSQSNIPLFISPSKPQKRGNSISGAKLGLICLGVIFLCMIALAMSFSNNGSTVISKTLSVPEIKNQSQVIPYESLMRNPENYKNIIVHFRGQVVQVQNIYGDNYVLRIATKEAPYLGYFDNIIYVDYNGERLLEHDMVDLWGNFAGLKSYIAVLGNQITIPEIKALHLEIIEGNGISNTQQNVADYPTYIAQQVYYTPTPIIVPTEVTPTTYSIAVTVSRVNSSYVTVYYGGGFDKDKLIGLRISGSGIVPVVLGRSSGYNKLLVGSSLTVAGTEYFNGLNKKNNGKIHVMVSGIFNNGVEQQVLDTFV